MENEQLIRQVAAELGVEAAIALGFAEAESNGRMVYGHDAGGVHSTRDGAVTVDGIEWPKGSNIPVTDASFRELERRVAAGEKSNGVGIMQITYRGFFPDARSKGLNLATAADNLRYGLTLIRGYLRAAPADVDPLAYAASRYNRGHWAGPYHYTDRVARLVQAWRDKETPVTPEILARADWQAAAPKGESRVSWPNIKIVNIHWPGSSGTIGTDKARIASALRGWQRYHQSTKGWRDIAYNVGVDLAGRVWLLRGWDRQDGGVAGRSDDVTILLIMGAGDQMTDAMKLSTLWAMREFERRKGGQLTRSWHGALSATSCPGPEATAWAKAGFLAPTTTQLSPEEDPLMSLSTTDQTLLVEAAKRIMGVTPSPDVKDPATGSHATLLDKADGHYIVSQINANGQAAAQIAGELAGLREALKLAATDGEALDLDLISAAAKSGAEQALTAAHGPLLAAIEDLTAAVDLLDAGAVTQQLADALARVRVHLIEES